jgi:hypothetical protein
MLLLSSVLWPPSLTVLAISSSMRAFLIAFLVLNINTWPFANAVSSSSPASSSSSASSSELHYNIPDPGKKKWKLFTFVFIFFFNLIIRIFVLLECTGSFGLCTQADKDKLGYQAIKKLHEMMDDDRDGQVEVQETKEVKLITLFSMYLLSL